MTFKKVDELIEMPEVVSEGKIVEFISVIGGFKVIPPTLSTELSCPICNRKEHAVVFHTGKNDSTDKRRVWICISRDCATLNKENTHKTTYIPTQAKRAVEWPLFCEINGIGDENHDVKFEDVKQTEARISFMLKFVANPRGILLMRGTTGSGKSYAAMAMCELFTRTNSDAIYLTQKQMSAKWLETFRQDRIDYFTPRVTSCNLLVIDDFGLKDPSPSFLEFFMDLIDTRLQWSNRGTVITTNLDSDKLSEYCGEALTDRINTGQLFNFTNKSRREPTLI